jgi:hypothetical protein
MLRIKRFALVGMLFFSISFIPTKAQTDTSRVKTEEIILTQQPDLKLDQEKKRQNKTEKLVFVSCLFIVLTTILLYNVRSK